MDNYLIVRTHPNVNIEPRVVDSCETEQEAQEALVIARFAAINRFEYHIVYRH